MIFSARGAEWDLSRKVLIMGVMNITPDSFSDGGECLGEAEIRARAAAFAAQGADIIDVGGESSRPGAFPVSAEEEMARVLPAIRIIKAAAGLPISVDTVKAVVARGALEEGAAIINDISGLKADPEMGQVAAAFQAGIILMHRRGNAVTMRALNCYENLVEEVKKELQESIDSALQAGISYARIALDPGIGFAKNREQNLSLLKRIQDFKAWDRPLVIGTSRKSFIGDITGKPAAQRLAGTAATVAWAVAQGAQILRVHDVSEMKDVTAVTQAILQAQ